MNRFLSGNNSERRLPHGLTGNADMLHGTATVGVYPLLVDESQPLWNSFMVRQSNGLRDRPQARESGDRL